MSEHHDDADPRLSSGIHSRVIEGDESGPGHASDQNADQASERRAELLGAAAADDLSEAEQQELDAMCAQDPQLALELGALREFGTALRRGLGSWCEDAPPGALGSLEPLTFSDRGVDIDGVLIANRRGTETVLEIAGLPEGDTFTAVLVTADGQGIESESFLGSKLPVECRINATVLRRDVKRLEIRDPAGLVILAAELSAGERPDAE